MPYDVAHDKMDKEAEKDKQEEDMITHLKTVVYVGFYDIDVLVYMSTGVSKGNSAMYYYNPR